jgi:2Fe-2S ferredoxin
MPKLIVVTRDGEVREVQARSGISVMQVIRNAGIDEVLALCGGCRVCASCHVHVDSAFMDTLPPMDDGEKELLDGSSHRNEYSRLSCQIPFVDALDGLKVQIALEDS